MDMDKEFLSAPIKSPVDKYQLIPEFLKVRGLVKEHLDSYNYFVTTDIKKIVEVNNEIRSSQYPDCYLKFKDVKVGDPSIMSDGKSKPLTPQFCRLSDLTYAAPRKAPVEYACRSQKLNKIYEKHDVVIGRMSVMLRSCCCILYRKDETELTKLGECPLDPGGYFVVKGNEKVILIQEQLSNNRIIIDVNKKGNTTTFRSKTSIVMEKEKLYLDLNQFQTKVPIQVMMKAMGMECVQEVVQMIGRDPRYTSLLLPSIEVTQKC